MSSSEGKISGSFRCTNVLLFFLTQQIIFLRKLESQTSKGCLVSNTPGGTLDYSYGALSVIDGAMPKMVYRLLPVGADVSTSGGRSTASPIGGKKSSGGPVLSDCARFRLVKKSAHNEIN